MQHHAIALSLAGNANIRKEEEKKIIYKTYGHVRMWKMHLPDGMQAEKDLINDRFIRQYFNVKIYHKIKISLSYVTVSRECVGSHII